MKILYVGLEDISLPTGPGVNERVFLADMFKRLGDDFCAVTPEPANGRPEELSDLNIVSIPVHGSARHATGWLLARTLGSHIVLRTLRRFQPDLTVMRYSPLPIPQFFASRYRRVPYVLKTQADVSLRKHYANHPTARYLRRLNTALTRCVIREASCIDLVSSAKRDNLIAFDPTVKDRVHIIDNGVDVTLFDGRRSADRRRGLGFSEEDVVIGYAGGLPMRRGGKEVIDVVANGVSPWVLKGLIVGDSGEAEHCREYARERGVESAVVVFGAAPYSDVPDLMGCMDLGLSILRSDERGASEQKVRQYLAMGLCVVGTAGSNDFLRDKNFARVVATECSMEVAAAVASLLKNGRDTLLVVGQQARRYAVDELAITAKNDLRIQLWAEAVSGG
jgi:glycosyltransferase involved in cell wall biosynthesis